MSGVLSGDEVRVDLSSIEKSLADLWRGETREGEPAVTRAALWNVVAHTASPEAHAQASRTLSNASASVPQRTIVIRAEPGAPDDMTSWISANCHLLGDRKQVCSEEVSIVAGGRRIHDVAPIVNALLIPDMPVAVWWLGDLPNDPELYGATLLEPADRLIVDSSYFDSPADLRLVSRIAHQTTTAPADLNWVRLEAWRVATAALFDPPSVRALLPRIRTVRVVTNATGRAFGDYAESLLYAGWLSGQAGHRIHDDGKVEGAAGSIDYRMTSVTGSGDTGSLLEVSIDFDDGSAATVRSDEERGALTTTVSGISQAMSSVTRALAGSEDDLIARQLNRSDADRVFMRVLLNAVKLAERLRT